jgi:antitoxin component YwqK of YwqJK toxin-antitoxin module
MTLKCTHKESELAWPVYRRYEIGQMNLKCTYEDSERHGTCSEWHQNGQLKYNRLDKDAHPASPNKL